MRKCAAIALALVAAKAAAGDVEEFRIVAYGSYKGSAFEDMVDKGRKCLWSVPVVVLFTGCTLFE